MKWKVANGLFTSSRKPIGGITPSIAYMSSEQSALKANTKPSTSCARGPCISGTEIDKQKCYHGILIKAPVSHNLHNYDRKPSVCSVDIDCCLSHSGGF